jgi:aldose 1-epimerase
MKKIVLIGFALLLFVISVSATEKKTMSAQPYVAEQIAIDGISVIRLYDTERDVEVLVLPSNGNIAYAMKIHGQNILGGADIKPADFQKGSVRGGIPFMAPWANRLDEHGFWANGTKYTFDPALANYGKDQNQLPLHGLITNSPYWKVTNLQANKKSASVTSRLEFWKHPDLMAQWPFAHDYEMTYRLAEGVLEVRITVFNLSAQSMPIAVGFHPYFRIPGVLRDEWILRNPARKAVVVDHRLIPTGEFKAKDLPDPMPLKGRTLDDGFTDLERDAAGSARFSIESGENKIKLTWGAKYPVAIIWEPAMPGGKALDFICVEPMSGITNATNLNHAGKYPDLQTILSGDKWTESFFIQAEGF